MAPATAIATGPHRTARPDPASGEPVYVIGLGTTVTLRLTAYSVLLFFLAAGAFSAITGGSASGGAPGGWAEPVLYVAVYFAAIVAHELVHGLFFRIFGGRPRYGAGVKHLLPYFYATSTGDVFSLRQMIVIGLAPLLTISALSLLAALLAPSLVGYLAVVFIGNAAGAVGDVWMTSRLVGFLPVKDVTVVDLVDGMAIHSRDAGAAAIAARLTAGDERPAGFAVYWMAAALVTMAVQFLTGLVGPYFTDSLTVGPPQFPLVAFSNSSRGAVWTFNLAPPLVAGLIFALAARWFSRGRA